MTGCKKMALGYQVLAVVGLATLGLPMLGWAQGAREPGFADVPPPPTLPGPITEADLLQPEVVIRQEGENQITEYRVGGRTYLIKVTPPVGEPYYLVDRSGKGVMERVESVPTLSPPMWVIKSWK